MFSVNIQKKRTGLAVPVVLEGTVCECSTVCVDLYVGFCVMCTSRVGVCGSGGTRQHLIPALGRRLLVSVLSSLLLLLRQLLVLP